MELEILHLSWIRRSLKFGLTGLQVFAIPGKPLRRFSLRYLTNVRDDFPQGFWPCDVGKGSSMVPVVCSLRTLQKILFEALYFETLARGRTRNQVSAAEGEPRRCFYTNIQKICKHLVPCAVHFRNLKVESFGEKCFQGLQAATDVWCPIRPIFEVAGSKS